MDAGRRQVYETLGRTGTMLRGWDAVCPTRSAHDPPNRFSDGLERAKDFPIMPSLDSLNTRREIIVGDKTYAYYSLAAAEAAGLAGISRLPVSMKVLLENLLRNEDGISTTKADLEAIAAWLDNRGSAQHEISFRPARVLMQ